LDVEDPAEGVGVFDDAGEEDGSDGGADEVDAGRIDVRKEGVLSGRMENTNRMYMLTGKLRALSVSQRSGIILAIVLAQSATSPPEKNLVTTSVA
jgi:hypothetical protein